MKNEEWMGAHEVRRYVVRNLFQDRRHFYKRERSEELVGKREVKSLGVRNLFQDRSRMNKRARSEELNLKSLVM